MSNDAVHSNNDPKGRELAAIILAAGLGKRMNSDLPKVVHVVAQRPMVWWVVKAAREAGATKIILIVGHRAELVKEVFAGDDHDIEYALQAEQLGTGHATNCARANLKGFEGDVAVLAGDGPLIGAGTIRIMHERHVQSGAAVTLATSVIDDPTGYGRIVRDSAGGFEAIVEQKNATDEQKAIREIYPSYACFVSRLLFESLDTLEPNSVTHEYYVTDIPSMLKAVGHRVELVDAVPPEDVLSINTLDQLAEVDAILTSRLQTSEAKAGS